MDWHVRYEWLWRARVLLKYPMPNCSEIFMKTELSEICSQSYHAVHIIFLRH